jgi:hypothetical protein
MEEVALQFQCYLYNIIQGSKGYNHDSFIVGYAFRTWKNMKKEFLRVYFEYCYHFGWGFCVII